MRPGVQTPVPQKKKKKKKDLLKNFSRTVLECTRPHVYAHFSEDGNFVLNTVSMGLCISFSGKSCIALYLQGHSGHRGGPQPSPCGT
jgi:hypothetical protein